MLDCYNLIVYKIIIEFREHLKNSNKICTLFTEINYFSISINEFLYDYYLIKHPQNLYHFFQDLNPKNGLEDFMYDYGYPINWQPRRNYIFENLNEKYEVKLPSKCLINKNKII